MDHCSTVTSGEPMKDLPQEMMLPVKSLLRFKLVSKLWLSLILDPDFAKSHFERASNRLLCIADHEVRSIDFEASFDSSVAVIIFLLHVLSKTMKKTFIYLNLKSSMHVEGFYY